MHYNLQIVVKKSNKNNNLQKLKTWHSFSFFALKITTYTDLLDSVLKSTLEAT